VEKRKPRIFIIEDEKPIARALELKLQKEGCETKVTFDGASALDILAKEKFDLIILDLILPEVDGFEVLRTLRVKDAQTPVIIASNLSQSEDLDKAKSLGANDYFVKSNTPIAEIVKNIYHFLEKS